MESYVVDFGAVMPNWMAMQGGICKHVSNFELPPWQQKWQHSDHLKNVWLSHTNPVLAYEFQQLSWSAKNITSTLLWRLAQPNSSMSYPTQSFFFLPVIRASTLVAVNMLGIMISSYKWLVDLFYLIYNKPGQSQFWKHQNHHAWADWHHYAYTLAHLWI